MNEKEINEMLRQGIKNASHFYNAITVANADGKLTEKEERYLTTLAEKYKINKNELLFIKSGTFAKRGSSPATPEKKLEQILELVIMMLADGEAAESEKKICKKVAVEYGFEENLIDKIVKSLWKLGTGETKNKPSDFESMLEYFLKKFKNEMEQAKRESRRNFSNF